MEPPVSAAMAEKTVFWRFQSRKLSVEIPFLSPPGGFSHTITICSGCG